MTSSKLFPRLPRFDILLFLGGAVASLAWIVLLLFTVWPYVSFLGAPQSFPAPSFHVAEFLKVSVFAGCAIMLAGAVREGRGAMMRSIGVYGAMNPADLGYAHRALPYYATDCHVAEYDRAPINSIEGRQCVVYSDGSVDVDTRLGPRRFSSVEEARLFFGAA